MNFNFLFSLFMCLLILPIIYTINPFTSEKYLLFPSIPYLVPLQNNRKNLVPSPLRRKQFKRFFDCASKLMESQLLRACKRSLRDFVNYVADGKVNIHICLPRSIDMKSFPDEETRTRSAFPSSAYPLSRALLERSETQFPSISAYQSFSRLVRSFALSPYRARNPDVATTNRRFKNEH